MNRRTRSVTDYDYYLVDCSRIYGPIRLEHTRLIRSEDVCGYLTQKFDEWLKRNPLHNSQSKRQWFSSVRCYPVAEDGSIIKDHSIMREIWLSYDGNDA